MGKRLPAGAVAGVIAALLIAGTAARSTAAQGSPHVHVYFVQGEQLSPVVVGFRLVAGDRPALELLTNRGRSGIGPGSGAVIILFG